MTVGDLVTLKHDVDRYPHFVARQGSTGVISEINLHEVIVRMTLHIPGAEEWDNCIIWAEGDDITADCEIEHASYPTNGAFISATTGKTVSQIVLEDSDIPEEDYTVVSLEANRIMNLGGGGGRPSDAMRTAIHRYEHNPESVRNR